MFGSLDVILSVLKSFDSVSVVSMFPVQQPCLPLLHFTIMCLSTTIVDSLYLALKSIDRVDIVNMLEGHRTATGQQGGWEQDTFRSQHHDRDHLSSGITNGKRDHLKFPF